MSAIFTPFASIYYEKAACELYMFKMLTDHKKGVVEPLIFSVAVFILTSLLVQYLVYQQYLIARENEQEQLQQELNRVKDGFRGILNSNITVANALATIHKSFGSNYNFDTTAKQLLETNKYIDALQLTDGGVITHVYPLRGHEGTIGFNTLGDSTRRKEAEHAIKRRDIYFAGPRKLKEGGIGILGKVPMFSGGKLLGFSTVLTKLPTIVTALKLYDSSKLIYSYKLAKNNAADSSDYYFTKMLPGSKNIAASTQVNEGDWTLTVSYSSVAHTNNFPLTQALIGFLLALFAGAFMYRRIRQPYYLKEIIDAKTKELSAREKYYRTITEANYDATVLLDGTGKVLYQTPSVEKILGYSFAEMQLLDGIELIHPDDRERDSQAFIDLLGESRRIVHLTHRIRKKDGNYIWIESTYRNLLLDENIRGIVLNYHDITDKVIAQHQLAERVKELSTIYYANEILKDEHQSAGEVFTKIVELLPPGWQYPEICGARIVFDGQEYCTQNYRTSVTVQAEHFRLIDGRQGVIEVIYTEEKPHEYEGPFLKEERDLIRTLAETIVVYFNKASQQRERTKSEANFRSSFEHAAIGVALVSTGGKFVKVNQALCSMLGYSEDELLALTFAEITHPEDVGPDVENVKLILDGIKDFYRIEKRYIHKNGSIIWINLNAAIIRDSEHKPLYFVSQIENITERKESQSKFQDLVEKSLVGVYIVQQGRFVYVNPWIMEESGYSEKELTSISFDRYLHPDDVALVSKNIRARLSGEVNDTRYEVRVFKKTVS
ncbi:hypothetical protein CJD36_012415 [Flavipsychrobacter stenotrophus]|uniref:histidine kinase n=1 Tax=Flavipsychrobacter stenotrophus TaxID=2077091 RepID=A0A2S7SVN4_9BACT|nr:PAS domain S-box protein [Flavipsychrobacter stenotrophus]PQJ10768.1 hypothetical protein CJD36_012415 [Flavipsychrobacter stenotrophus]